MNGLLKKAAIQSNEIGKALNAVRASSKSMPYVKRFIRELSQSIEGIHPDQLMEENSLPLSTINGIRNISCKFYFRSMNKPLNYFYSHFSELYIKSCWKDYVWSVVSGIES